MLGDKGFQTRTAWVQQLIDVIIEASDTAAAAVSEDSDPAKRVWMSCDQAGRVTELLLEEEWYRGANGDEIAETISQALSAVRPDVADDGEPAAPGGTGDPERDRLLGTVTEFEARLREESVATRSPCGRVTVTCDHRGQLRDLRVSDRIPRDLTVDEAENLLVDTLNAAIDAPAAIRRACYDDLVVCGDTVANWRTHPPPPRSREAMVLGFVDILRAGMALRPHDDGGDDRVRN